MVERAPILCLSLAVLLAAAVGARADEVRVGVASNFVTTFDEIARRFESGSAHDVVAVAGSTGKLYAQIRSGLELDLFLAADSERPARLEAAGLAVEGSRFTYAVGRLALWGPGATAVDEGTLAALEAGTRLAIANPELAPYGRAARETLAGMGLWERLAPRLVYGENVGQAFQFVASGNARLGLVAYAQLRRPEWRRRGAHWLVPEARHAPIEQQAVLLRDGRAARELVAFLRGETVRRLLEEEGYGVP